MSSGRVFVFEVSLGYCLHDYMGALVGMGSLGLVRGGREETSLDRVLWFCCAIFVLGLFRHLIGCLAYYLVIELFLVEFAGFVEIFDYCSIQGVGIVFEIMYLGTRMLG